MDNKARVRRMEMRMGDLAPLLPVNRGPQDRSMSLFERLVMDRGLPLQAAFRISRLIPFMERAATDYINSRNRIIEEIGKPELDEDGKEKIDPRSGKPVIKVAPGDPAFVERMNALHEETIAIDFVPITIGEMGRSAGQYSPGELHLLRHFIIPDPEPETSGEEEAPCEVPLSS